MKKFFAIAFIAATTLVACNNAAEVKDTADSTAAVIDSTATAAKDSLTSVVDSAKQVIDSTAKAAVDSIKK